MIRKKEKPHGFSFFIRSVPQGADPDFLESPPFFISLNRV